METLLAKLAPPQAAMLRAISDHTRVTGAAVYLVGGAVRDWILGAPSIDDLDFSVDGDSVGFVRDLQREHGGELLVHEKFRTARWVCQGASVDVAMSRAEFYARPGALPTVSPAPIEVDLRRRDFAANAIACRLSDGVVVDPFQGRRDLEHRLLRGLHEHSFVDDPTRMLRGARYAARLGFAFDEGTLEAIQRGVPHLRALSGERIKYDFELIFRDREPAAALRMLREFGVFGALGVPMPDPDKLDERFARIWSVFTKGEYVLDALDLAPDRLLNAAGWGALIYAQGQLAVRRWLELAPFEHDVREALIAAGALSTMSAQMFHAPTSRQSALLHDFSGLTLLFGHLFDGSVLKRRAIHCEWKDWRWVRPTINGEDLRARGVPPGPEYRRIFDALRDAWLDGRVLSLADEQRLLDEILAR
ncbi:MAG: hypothetical protein NTZ50_15790 [Chloroflexi bacterium]|nr:hypothetical protein [Chloroflexota bacterium]